MCHDCCNIDHDCVNDNATTTTTTSTTTMSASTFNMLPDMSYTPGLSGGTIQSHHCIDMLLLHIVYVQIDPTRGIKKYFFSPKDCSNQNIVGKARQGRFWTFSASLRTIPASICPQKI